MAPTVFYRVEDEYSRARYYLGFGISAEDTDTRVNLRSYDETLCQQVAKQLDWYNRIPTQFISVYSDKGVAMSQANRRVEKGRQEVRVYKIDMRMSHETAKYRNVRLLAEKADCDIPERAWNNSEFEYVFLRHVPESAVKGWIDVKLERRI